MPNKKIIILLVLVSIAAVSVTAVSAQGSLDITSKLTNVGTAAGFSSTSPNIATTIGQIIQGVLSLIGVIFMAYIIYSGYLWMIARGNDESITKAKAILRGSIIGVIIILLAYTITSFVISRVTTATGYAQSQTAQ